MSRVVLVVCIAATGALVAMGWAVDHYRTNALQYKEQRDTVTGERDSANATIDVMKVRQLELGALDEKYTKDLANAKATIEQLRRDVDAGAKRLRINAACASLSNASGPARLDDAAAPRLTDAAERDYFRLRERIEIAGKQIAGLQEYVIKFCLK
ncbi:lysis protein [Cedecea sp. S5-13]|uniref:lysis protein n=1 Tax=Cedecea selenatireducens TaxID=3144416 RepID=UPI0035CD0A3F